MTPSRYRIDLDLHVASGAAFVVLGGLVAAVSRPLDVVKGSWLAAYLVLVVGVALVVIGAAQQQLDTPVEPRIRTCQLAGWGIANILVITGSLSSNPAITDAGSVLLFVTLILTAWIGKPLLRTRRIAACLYIGVLTVLAVSVPIGSALAHTGT